MRDFFHVLCTFFYFDKFVVWFNEKDSLARGFIVYLFLNFLLLSFFIYLDYFYIW